MASFVIGLSFSSVYAGIPWDTADIADEAITTEKIKDKTIKNIDLKGNNIKSGKIKDGTITSADIADATIKGADIAIAEIGGREIGANQVNSGEIATDAVRADEIQAGAVGTSEIADGTIVEGDLSASLLSSLSGSSYVPFARVLGSNMDCDQAGGGSTTTRLHLDSEDGKPFIVTSLFVRIASVNNADDSVEIGKIRANGISLNIDSGDLTGTSTDNLDFDVLGQAYSTGENSPHQLASNGVGVDHIRVEFICDAGDLLHMFFIFNTMASGWMESDDNILFTTSPAP